VISLNTAWVWQHLNMDWLGVDPDLDRQDPDKMIFLLIFWQKKLAE
jgi:hypothetical protein